MPTYEYRREDGIVFEVFQGINDAPLTTCPDTGQPVHRIISGGGGVVYKGSGWYVTDYKNASPTASGSGSGNRSDGTVPTASAETSAASGSDANGSSASKANSGGDSPSSSTNASP